MLSPRQIHDNFVRFSYQPKETPITSPPDGAAVRAFQHDTGLTNDGIYGPKTDAALSLLASRALPQLDARYARWRVTRYYVVDEGDFMGPMVPMIIENSPSISVRAAFFAHAALEGSGRLADGRLVNVVGGRLPVPNPQDYLPVLTYAQQNMPLHPQYAGLNLRESGEIVGVQHFELVKTLGVGYGTARKLPLIPYRSLAADLGAYMTSDARFRGVGGLVPVGTKVYLPELKGQVLPGIPEGHDGWCLVHDTGTAIAGAHFDLFCGTARMSRAVQLPTIAHAWFQIVSADGKVMDTIEDRVPYGYLRGLIPL